MHGISVVAARRAVRLTAVFIAAVMIGCAPEADPADGDGATATADADSLPSGAAGGGVDVPEDEGVHELMGAAWTAAETKVERAVAGAALLMDVRTAAHAGFDRIVLDFGSDGVPGYRIGYIDGPVRQCGSGDVVSLAGEGRLSVTVEPANAHTEAGEPTVQERERMPGLPTVLELKVICDFEAMVELVAGVSSPEHYRVFELTAPGRLVIDIRHAGTEP